RSAGARRRVRSGASEAVLLPLRGVVQHAARQAQHATRATFGHVGLGPHGNDGFPPRLRAQNFPRATTFYASLSSIASASSFLSFAFSASSARSRFAS